MTSEELNVTISEEVVAMKAELTGIFDGIRTLIISEDQEEQAASPDSSTFTTTTRRSRRGSTTLN